MVMITDLAAMSATIAERRRMKEKVERVARALHDVDPTIWVGDPKMGYYRQAARAAISAIAALESVPDPLLCDFHEGERECSPCVQRRHTA
jgi:2C-methyl-D-erythritol 2,4-cyclodiphosphate synthase